MLHMTDFSVDPEIGTPRKWARILSDLGSGGTGSYLSRHFGAVKNRNESSVRVGINAIINDAPIFLTLHSGANYDLARINGW